MKATKKNLSFTDLYAGFDGGPQESRSLFGLLQELRSGLQLYWKTAEKVLAGSAIRLIPVAEDHFSLERNFFSTLFLYSYYRAGITTQKRTIYVAINQCLRGMVTGCDNVLDNEYKMTLDTDLPADATRFRSILDIMVSDRVLSDLLTDLCQSGQITFDQMRSANAASLRSLARSGVEEASEEAGIRHHLSSEDILTHVHHLKTGMLFRCVWAIPAIIEARIPDGSSAMEASLYRIGMGCQVFDDMVDLLLDIGMKRHNYVAALAREQLSAAEWKGLQKLAGKDITRETTARFYADHPAIARSAYQRALGFLETGLRDLFAPEHARLVDPAIRFISGRIGSDGVMRGISLD